MKYTIRKGWVHMAHSELSRSNTKQITKRNNLWFIVIGLFILFVLSYIFISFYYNTHFYMNTIINGVDVSNMTVEEAEEVIQKEFRNYSLRLVGRNDLTSQINGEDFNIRAKFDGSLE